MKFDTATTSGTLLVLDDKTDKLVDILIMQEGEITCCGNKDAFVNSEEGAEIIMSEFAKRDRQIVVDYDHQTEGGIHARADGKSPAAGWIHSLRFEKGRGLIAKVEWTAEARKSILSGEYRYLSPVVMLRKDDRLAVELRSVAITNIPAMDGVERLAANIRKDADMPKGTKLKTKKSRGDLFSRIKKMSKLVCMEATPEEEVAEAEAVVEEVDAVGAAIAALKAEMGLGEDAAPADSIMAAVEAIREAKGSDEEAPAEDAAADEAVASVNSIRETLSLSDDAPLKDVVKAVDKLVIGKVDAKRLVGIEAELKVLKDAKRADDIDAAVMVCVNDGRLNPHDDDRMAWARKRASSVGVEAFSELMEGLPPTWEPGSITDGSGSASPANDRDRLIASARKDWNDNPDQRMGASVNSWVDTVLVTENRLSPMTADEKQAMKA